MTPVSETASPVSVSESRRDVALIVETSNAYARGLLRGIRNYVTANPGWSIYLGEHGRREVDLSWLDGWRGDGVIARVENRETADRVRRLNMPTVDLSAFRYLPEVTAVETNDEAIVQMGIGHLSERGFRHFAFCGDPRFQWSTNRAGYFAKAVRDLGAAPLIFQMNPAAPLADNRMALAAWLVGLPKPVGVLGCYDVASQEVLEASKLGGLTVPDEVGVVGVDNDELICNLTDPPLTSIQTDATGSGYFAAELLGRMMNGQSLTPSLHLIDPLRVVSRHSSDAVSVADPIVARGLRFIRERVDLNCSVRSVERHVGLSRRALDYRFVKVVGRTVHEDIMRTRIERVAQLLIDTDWTLAEIAGRMQFHHAEYMGVVFKRYNGIAPGQYRKSNRD